MTEHRPHTRSQTKSDLHPVDLVQSEHSLSPEMDSEFDSNTIEQQSNISLDPEISFKDPMAMAAQPSPEHVKEIQRLEREVAVLQTTIATGNYGGARPKQMNPMSRGSLADAATGTSMAMGDHVRIPRTSAGNETFGEKTHMEGNPFISPRGATASSHPENGFQRSPLENAPIYCPSSQASRGTMMNGSSSMNLPNYGAPGQVPSYQVPQPTMTAQPRTSSTAWMSSSNPALVPEHRSPKDEPRARLPKYDGKGPWKAFWMQFQLLSLQYSWDDETFIRRLINCLEKDAAEFVAEQPYDVLSSRLLLVNALEQRFKDHTLPETHRANLATVRKSHKESLHEYAARVQNVANKAYPGMERNAFFEQLVVEHLISGLPDPNLIYDVQTKKPRTMTEALNLIQWHESCKSSLKKKSHVRHVHMDNSDEDFEDTNIRRLNQKRFVTEERLQSFGRALEEKIDNSKKGMEEKLDTILKLVGQKKEGSKTHPTSTRSKPKTDETKATDPATDVKLKIDVTCFKCKEPGHYARNCPSTKKFATREVQELDSESEDDEAYELQDYDDAEDSEN